MDQGNEKRFGEPEMGTNPDALSPPAPTVAVTLGGTDAGPATETYTALGENEPGGGPIATRVLSREQEYAGAVQRAESMSGLDAAQSDYERDEFGQGQMDELRDDVLVGARTGPTPAPRGAP